MLCYTAHIVIPAFIRPNPRYCRLVIPCCFTQHISSFLPLLCQIPGTAGWLYRVVLHSTYRHSCLYCAKSQVLPVGYTVLFYTAHIVIPAFIMPNPRYCRLVIPCCFTQHISSFLPLLCQIPGTVGWLYRVVLHSTYRHSCLYYAISQVLPVDYTVLFYTAHIVIPAFIMPYPRYCRLIIPC